MDRWQKNDRKNQRTRTMDRWQKNDQTERARGLVSKQEMGKERGVKWQPWQSIHCLLSSSQSAQMRLLSFSYTFSSTWKRKENSVNRILYPHCNEWMTPGSCMLGLINTPVSLIGVRDCAVDTAEKGQNDQHYKWPLSITEWSVFLQNAQHYK